MKAYQGKDCKTLSAAMYSTARICPVLDTAEELVVSSRALRVRITIPEA